jgi:two-component system, LytTR family, response regulator
MNAIIVDDEQANIENLQILLDQYCPSVKIVACSMQVEQAVTLIQLNQPDLVFLDIQLGKKTGFDLLSKLNEKLFEVIFVTAYDHYGIQAIKFAALDYLLKPVNPAELVNSVQKAESRLRHKQQNEQLSFLLQQLKVPETNSPKIALPQQNEIRYVLVNDIVRCEADNTYTFFFLSGGDKILISKPLKEYTGLLAPYGFLRVHQSHLVNPAYVQSWLKEDGGILLIKNGDKIPISKPNREYVKTALGK